MSRRGSAGRQRFGYSRPPHGHRGSIHGDSFVARKKLAVRQRLAFASLGASAGAPQAKGQAPGWYRMMIGDFEVTALADGTVGLRVDKANYTSNTPGK
jgi:hypothetical protein